MKKNLFKLIPTLLLAVLTFSPSLSHAIQATDNISIFDGYYSREGNSGSPSRTHHHNIYMKLYAENGQQWVAMLHIPLPYALSVDPLVIPKVFENVRKQINSSAFVRDTFGHLEEKATVQFERFGYMQDKIIFECGSLSPCTIKPTEDHLELIKPGMINEHIIIYHHIVAE